MPEHKIRYHYIDWMRIIAFSVLIFLHSMVPFTSIPWEIKNNEGSYALTTLTGWLHQWRLPLLFFVSGMGIQFSMESRSLLSFYGERFRRLFIPLLFAMFFTIPLQPYYEFLQEGKIKKGYFDFYSRVWNLEIYPNGPLTWSHMWFVVYLIAFILLLLPLFGIFKIKALATFKRNFSEILGHPLSMVLMVLPLMAIFYRLYIEFPENASLTEDWFAFSFFICFLVYGYFVGSSKSFWANAEKYRWIAGGIALAAMVVLFVKYWKPLAAFETADQDFLIYTYHKLHTYLEHHDILLWHGEGNT
jgi:hypothetical protein